MELIYYINSFCLGVFNLAVNYKTLQTSITPTSHNKYTFCIFIMGGNFLLTFLNYNSFIMLIRCFFFRNSYTDNAFCYF